LYIEGREDPQRIQSFIVPRWGGVIIYNPASTSTTLPTKTLHNHLSVFRRQLNQLLGVPPLPPSLARTQTHTDITEWQLDALFRRRTRENVKDSRDALGSTTRLVDSITSLPVGKAVRDDVRGALDSLFTLHLSSSEATAALLSPLDRLKLSAKALKLSSRAFFHPSMVGMLYFPAEHTYAVYLPLFAPALMPLVVALIKEIKAWRQERRQSIARVN